MDRKLENSRWWSKFGAEFFKLSGGPGNKPTCGGQALSRIAGEFNPIQPSGASILQAFAPAAQASAINGSISATQAAVDAHIAARGLTVPLRSSIVRGLLAKGEGQALAAGSKAFVAVQTLAVDYAAVTSLISTSQDARTGACAAAWPVF